MEQEYHQRPGRVRRLTFRVPKRGARQHLAPACPSALASAPDGGCKQQVRMPGGPQVHMADPTAACLASAPLLALFSL